MTGKTYGTELPPEVKRLLAAHKAREEFASEYYRTGMGLNVTPDCPYNKKIGPFYLKWFRRDSWFIWFRTRLLMSYFVPKNAHLGRHIDDARPRFKFRLGKLSVDYD